MLQRINNIPHIGGTSCKQIVRKCVELGLVKFPSQAVQKYCLEGGERPAGWLQPENAVTEIIPEQKKEVAR